MAGSKPAALPLGYTPVFTVARGIVTCSMRGRVPVVSPETQAQVTVLEIDPPRNEHRVRIGLARTCELIALVCDPPKTLLQSRECAVRAGLGLCVELRIGQSEQPRMQASHGQPPSHELRNLR